jgi:chromatin segregation and condensation protein Rec8/ScpA/Scc1 (kleisin family)
VLVAFLAVLVLVRRRTIEAEQAGLFGEITLRRVAPAPLARLAALPPADD